MKLRAALLVQAVALWLVTGAQNETFDAQRLAPPAAANDCPPAGTITVTRVNNVVETVTVTKNNPASTVTQNNAAVTVTSCPEAASGPAEVVPNGLRMGCVATTKTVTATMPCGGTTKTVTATLPCTKVSTVTSYLNCVPVRTCPLRRRLWPADDPICYTMLT